MLCGFHGNFVKMISRGKNELFFIIFVPLCVIWMWCIWTCISALWCGNANEENLFCGPRNATLSGDLVIIKNERRKKKVFWLWGENTKVSRRGYKSQPHRIVKMKEFIRKNRRRRKCIFSGNTVDKNLTSDDE